MRVSLFGLFLRCTSLMGPWPKRIQSILLVISFTLDFLFYDDYVVPVHIYFTCVLTLLSSVLDTRAHPGSPPGLHITTRLGSFTDSPGFSCPGFGAWSEWISPVTAQSGAAIAWISSRLSRATSFQAPCVPLEFSFCKLVSALYTVHTCTSPWIPAIAHISDIIFMNIGSPLVITL